MPAKAMPASKIRRVTAGALVLGLTAWGSAPATNAAADLAARQDMRAASPAAAADLAAGHDTRAASPAVAPGPAASPVAPPRAQPVTAPAANVPADDLPNVTGALLPTQPTGRRRGGAPGRILDPVSAARAHGRAAPPPGTRAERDIAVPAPPPAPAPVRAAPSPESSTAGQPARPRDHHGGPCRH